MMDEMFSLSGTLRERGIPAILYAMYKQFIDGTLVVAAGGSNKRFSVFNRKLMFASSGAGEDSFGAYLLRSGAVDEHILQKARQYRSERELRLGRALLELGHLDADGLWRWVTDHLKEIVFSSFPLIDGEYEILTDSPPVEENIVLAAEIPSLIVEGMRRFEAAECLDLLFPDVENLYIGKGDLASKLALRPYEHHVLDLVRREPAVEAIIKKSELLEFDTRKILYLFLVLEIVSTEEGGGQAAEQAKHHIAAGSGFASFEEALKYYNMKYELIFRTLSKEIGPIALSILSRAITGIIGNLPAYLKKVQLNSDGSLKKDFIIKSLWYHDFDTYIGEFLRGLEEILYAEIYAVREHLGIEYEQQILRWINQVGN
jgi:hypothetical protein